MKILSLEQKPETAPRSPERSSGLPMPRAGNPAGRGDSRTSGSTIHRSDADLKHAWRARFQALPPAARHALRAALLDLREDALRRAQFQWRRHKAPMACYWKVVGVYAGHLARALR